MSRPSESTPIALYKVKNGSSSTNKHSELNDKHSELTKFIEDTYDFTISDLDKLSSKTNKLKCMARKTNYEQCNRNKKDNTDYCSCHNKSRPNGRIDEEINKDQTSTPKKRGPKFKSKQLAMDNINLDLYQQVKLIKIDDNQYYIDDNGILYAKNDSGNIIGHKEKDLIKWFK